MSRLSSDAFEKLLQVLATDRESAGVAYEDLRQRMIRFFRWESCPGADECADDVLNRLASKLFAGERISNPVAYAGGIARLVLKETNRKQAREQQLPLTGPVDISASPLFAPSSVESNEPLERCFDGCLDGIGNDSRHFLLDYYSGEAASRILNRQMMAGRLEISLNSLRNRALRLREKLESCIDECMGRGA